MTVQELDVSQNFLRAAQQRFTAAGVLFSNGFNLEAVYLAGYAIECSLKAVILRCTSQSEHDTIVARFKKRGGHDFEALKQLLSNHKINIPSPLNEKLRRDAWSTDLRYRVGTLPAEDAEAFMAAAEAALQWATAQFVVRKLIRS